MPGDAKSHYDHVTDAWKEFMGDHFHFGYFETEDTDLDQAVVALTEKMLALTDISSDSRLLDVGCGIGGPAFYIHENYGCAIDGISTSDRGIQLANATSEEKGYDKVKFRVADGLDNGFPDNTFDIVWVMESSHLMADKDKLCRECFRVLKRGGTMVLCDLIVVKIMPFYIGIPYGLLQIRKYILLKETFGAANLVSLGMLCDSCLKAGYGQVAVFDISKQATPTLKNWKKNAQRFSESEIGDLSNEDVKGFIRSCDLVERFFKKGFYGYGILRAVK